MCASVYNEKAEIKNTARYAMIRFVMEFHFVGIIIMFKHFFIQRQNDEIEELKIHVECVRQ